MARKSRRNPPPKRKKTTRQAKIDSFLNNLIKGGSQSSSPVQGDSVMDRILRPKQTAQLETARQMTEDEFDELDELPEDVLTEMQDDVEEEYSEDEDGDDIDLTEWDDDEYDLRSGRLFAREARRSKVMGGRRKGRRLMDEESDSEDEDASLLKGGLDRYWDDDYEDNPTGMNPWLVGLAAVAVGGGVWFWTSQKNNKSS